MTNCKNCGAPVRGNECEYCGTVLEFKPVRHKEHQKEYNTYDYYSLLNNRIILQSFQREHDLIPDGIIGPDTQGMIYLGMACGYVIRN